MKGYRREGQQNSVEQGLQVNRIVQEIDLSNNELTDTAGIQVLNMIKFQAEKRDNQTWSRGLRSAAAGKPPFQPASGSATATSDILNIVVDPQNSQR